MADWRLTPDSEALLAKWRETASPAHQRRLGEVLESVGDGTWRGRWWNQPYPSNKDFMEIRAGDGLIIVVQGLLDGIEPVMWIDLAGVWVVDDDEADLGAPRD